MNMRFSKWMMALVLLLGSAAMSRGENAPKPIDVWPGKPPGDSGKTVEEKWDKKKVTDVTHPTIEIFRPAKESDTGVAVIICPGGGYRMLMMDYEGEDAAHWLNTIGVTGIVLKYRVPAPDGAPKWLGPLQDAQRTVSYVRSKSKEWGIDPAKIGMMGFSAGAHLTAATSTNFTKRAYDAIDEVDKVSCRPDFAVVIYPGGVIAKDKSADPLSPEITVTKDTPPAFICQANNDPVNPENSVYYYLALKKAGINADLHIYAAGGHGFGMHKSENPCATWPQRCAEWMQSIGVLKAK